MRKIAFGVSLFVALVMSGVALAAGIKTGSLEQLMNLSGLNKQVSDIPAGVVAGVQQARQQGAPLSDEQVARLEKTIAISFQTQKIKSTISRQLKSALNEAEAQELLGWYKSDIGKKITKAEEKASEEAAYQEMVSQAQTLLADKERVKLAQRMDSLVKATELTLDIQKNAGTAVVVAISKAMNPEQPVDIKAIEKSMAAEEQNIRQQMEQLVTLALVYNYKDISIPEINKYIEFLQKPSTQKFNAQAVAGFKTALKESVNSLATSVTAKN